MYMYLYITGQLLLNDVVAFSQYYQALYAAVVLVQRWYRLWSETREVRRTYLAMRRAVIVTQATWRGQLARRQVDVSVGIVISTTLVNGQVCTCMSLFYDHAIKSLM